MTEKIIATVARIPTIGIGYSGGEPLLGGLRKEETRYGGPWSVRAMITTTDAGALVVSKVTDSLISAVLKHSPLAVCVRADDLSNYVWRLYKEFNFLRMEASLGGVQSYSEAVSIIASKVESSNESLTESLPPTDSSWVLIPGLPNLITVSMWSRLTDGAPIAAYFEDDGTLHRLDIAELSNHCTDYRTLLTLGCLSCPVNDRCASHLSGNEFPMPETNISALKTNLIKVPDVGFVPPSIISRTRSNISVMDINMYKASEMLDIHKELVSKRAEARRFYDSNCQKCSLAEICGTRRLLDNKGEKSKFVGDFCSGKTSVSTDVTLSNYTRVLPFVIETLNTFKYRLKLPTEGHLLSLQEALGRLLTWVDTGSKVTREASAYLNNKLGLVAPREFVELMEALDFKGSYGFHYSWRDPLPRAWVKDITSETSEVFATSNPNSNWLVIDSEVKSCSNYYNYTARFIDATLSAKLIGIKLGGYTKKLSSRQSRLNMACYLIRQVLLPGRVMCTGAFGNVHTYLPRVNLDRSSYRRNSQVEALSSGLDSTNLISSLTFSLTRYQNNDSSILETLNKLKEIL